MGGTIVKLATLLIVLSIAKVGNTQNVFNKAFDEGNVSNSSPNALEYSNNIYFVQKVFINTATHLEAVKLDPLGNVISKKSIVSNSNLNIYYGFPGSLQILSTNELCQLYHIALDSTINLVFFDTNFNVIRSKSYIFNYFVNPAVIKQINDSTLLTLGRVKNTTKYNLFLINTDLQGNERWRTIFGEPGKDDYGYSIELVNNEIIVGGQTFENSTTAHPHLFSFNIQGNLVFDTTYSSFGNGGFLAYHTTYGLFLSASIEVTGGQNPAIIKLNQDLSINWSKIYFKDNPMTFLETIIVRDNGVISTSGSQIVNNEFIGIFFQTNQYGDSLNTKLIDHIPGKRAQFHDIRPTSDGGYIMAGETYIPSQDSWIVKVNGWGCDNIPCIVSVPEVSTTQGVLTCYPNPSSGAGTIKGSFKNANSTNQIKVFNSLGQLVFTKTIATKEFELEVNLPNSGLYLVVLYQNNLLVNQQKWVVR